MKVSQVLIVCSGNTCRSPMAAAMLRQLWDQSRPGWNLTVSSAGTGACPGLPAAEHAVTEMRSRGIDLSGHGSRSLSNDVLAQTDLVLTMTAQHKEQVLARWPQMAGRTFTIGEFTGAGRDVPDPFGGPLFAYTETARALELMLQSVVDRLRREGMSTNEGSSRL